MNYHNTQKLPPRFTELLQDRYAFLSILGLGGSGMVYEVRNLQMERLEAFKVLTNSLTPETTKRFAQEAKIASTLDHPGIVKVYDFGQLDGINWYSMQLIEGPSLSDIIDKKQLLDPVGAARLGIPILDALAYSHERGVIHRDIKPANILIQTSGYPCLTDFGIAKSADAADLTQTGYMMGTPAYMAPEQAEGKHVDGRADQYSLAITLYRAITGKLPFSSDEPMITLVQRLHEDPEPIGLHCPDFPTPLGDVLMKALSRNRDDRYMTIKDMQSAMQSACEVCCIQWDRPFEGFEHISVVKKPIEDNKTGLLGDVGKATPNKPKTRVPYAIFGTVALVTLVALGLLYFRQPVIDAVVTLDKTTSDQNGDTPSVGSSQIESVPEQQPKRRTEPVLPPPVSNSAITRRAVVRAQLLENTASNSITIPPELAGKILRVRVTVGEDGRVSKCTILDRDLMPALQDIAKSIAMNLMFSPALAEDGKPVVSELTFALPL